MFLAPNQLVDGSKLAQSTFRYRPINQPIVGIFISVVFVPEERYNLTPKPKK